MRKPIETSQFMTLPLPPAQRIERIREALKEERAAYRSAAAGSHDEHIAQLNIGNLEATLERAETNARIRTERLAGLQAAEDAKTEAHNERERNELEARLFAGYKAASPGTTEQEARDALPDLLHRHRLAEMDRDDRLVTQAAARMKL